MNVLITGGSRGLGIEIVRSQLLAGNQVIAVCRNSSDALQHLLVQYPSALKIVPCDLACPDESNRSVSHALEASAPIHGLVCNAAIAYDDLVTNLSLEPLEAMFRVNVFASMMLTKLVIRNMLLHQVSGSVVHISSICAHTGYKGLAMYAATKGAIEAFSKNTAREWGVKGIRSNCVVPGFLNTDMSSRLTEEQRQSITRRTALKKETSLSSVVAAVDFLLSDASESITGQNLVVDSGTI